ncbi:MAG: hypothetical protein Q9M92_06030 [Enterobacterales bacterium]|nr:hypothetical protein [Enterobacterales bacterium]
MTFKPKLIITILLVIGLSACIDSVSYNLNYDVTYRPFSVQIKDQRSHVSLKTKTEGYQSIIGDAQLTPPPIELISRKLGHLLKPSAASQIKNIDLNQFTLIIHAPEHYAIGKGAMMAGTSYNLGILVSEFESSNSRVGDGVMIKIKMSFNDVEYQCEKYQPAYDEIGDLWGIAVSGEALQKTFDETINLCLKSLLSKTDFDQY